MAKHGRTPPRLWLLALLLGALLAAPAAAETPRSSYGVASGVRAMAMGPDGTLWFTGGTGQPGRIKPDGSLESVGEGLGEYGEDLALDADGALWGVGRKGVARRTPAGEVTGFPLPAELGEPSAIAAAPGGGVWFVSWRQEARVLGGTESFGPAYVGRVAPDGRVESFPLPGEAGARNLPPPEIVLGPDGNLWVADPALARIDRVSPNGQIASFELPSAPSSLTSGPEGAIWYIGGRRIGRLSLDGDVTEFPIPGQAGGSIVAGPDGNLWFGSWNVRRMTPWGQVSSYPADGTGVTDLVAGRDGSVWAGTIGNPIKWVGGSIVKLPTGLPGVELASTETVARGKRFSLVLECGGSPTRGCAGEVRLGEGKAPLASYAISPESREKVHLRLPAAVQRRLARRYFSRERFSVTVEGGEEATRRVVLRVPRPLRRGVPPGKEAKIPLPDDALVSALAYGPGGDLWFADRWGDGIVRMTPKGKLRSYRLPMPVRYPRALTAGPLDSIWFLTEQTKEGRRYSGVGRLSGDGEFSEVGLPGETPAADLLASRDGNLWVARLGYSRGAIDRVTPEGQVTRFPVRDPRELADGPGGVWFTDSKLTIRRISPSGRITRFQVPGRGRVRDIDTGPDGNVWFTHFGRKGRPAVGTITSRGEIVEFPVHRRGEGTGMPGGLVAGPDGNLWFGEYRPTRITRITPQGNITRFPLPRGAEAPTGLVLGPGGDLWFSQRRSNEVGVFALPGRGRTCPARSAPESC